MIVDYANPPWWNPLRYLWRVVFALFEPFAIDLVSHDFEALLPQGMRIERKEYLGGFYRKVVAFKPAATK